MKKFLLAAAILAVASINSFGAACSNTTLNLLAGVSCTVGNVDQWTLSNLGIIGTPTTTYFAAVITSADLQVTFTNLGTNGFSVSFSDAPGGLDFFTLSNPAGSGTDQAVAWRNQIRVVGTAGAASSIVEINQSAAGFFGDGSLTVNKRHHDGAGNFVNLAAAVCQGCVNPTSSQSMFAAFGNTFYVNDVIDFNATNGLGGTATSGLTSYTNSFYAEAPVVIDVLVNGVPEPMTFVLMGAGLVGIAALRRRKR